ncbi:MAG: cysteine desulfurase [Candidatus Omnitrophica bacterium]|nr:cysteine desulfurase [Candidatus Omnitrophota bacterium]
MDKKIIYMDHNATTPLHPRVKEEMSAMMDVFGNPSSMHSFGRQAKRRIEDARETIAGFIAAKSDEIVFVGSGSEANNTVLKLFSCCSHRCAVGQDAPREVITTRIEHPCVMEASHCLRDQGIKVHYLDVDAQGKVNKDQLKTLLLSDKILLVSVMLANNEIGTIQDIKEIARIVHEKGIFLHTDAVQAVGKIPVDVNDLGVDFLSFSAHKIYGPKGVGALYVRQGVPFCPFIHGGHQERGRRAGTENTIGIVGFAKAIEMRTEEMHDEHQRLLRLKQLMKDDIQKKINDVYFNGHPVDSLAGTLNVSFEGAEGEALLLYLDLEGIAVSTGSACASGSLDPSHVLLATGVSAEAAHGSLRISLGRETTEEEVSCLLDKLPAIVKKVRGMSTAYSMRRK